MEIKEESFAQIVAHKEELQYKKNILEDQITMEFNSYGEKIKNSGKIALLAGLGAMVLYYSISAIFSSSTSKFKKYKNKSSSGNNPIVVQSESEEQSPIVKSILNYMTLFILGIAKEKIISFLSEVKSNYDKSTAKETNGKAS